MGFSKAVLSSYKKLIEENIDKKFTRERYKHNVLREGMQISEGSFWRAIVKGILTTQTTNNKTFRDNIKELKIDNYSYMKKVEDKAEYVKKLSGIRFTNKKPKAISRSMDILNEKWNEIKKHLETIKDETTLEKERKVADYIRITFQGNQIKFKQSRNIIQMMGLSQYVVPLDSRVMGILQEHGGIKMPGQKHPLNSNCGYCDIEDQVNELCAALGVKPCIFDACAFASKEQDFLEN